MSGLVTTINLNLNIGTIILCRTGWSQKVMRIKIAADDNLPLRGFLICPNCGKMPTGVASKGRTQHYHVLSLQFQLWYSL